MHTIKSEFLVKKKKKNLPLPTAIVYIVKDFLNLSG